MDVKNRVCIITGSCSILGTETAKAMASYGAHLILPVANLKQGESLKAEIINKFPQSRINLFQCNLLSLSSIRKFVKEFRKKHKKLHLLINIEIIKDPVRDVSEDGIEKHLAVNHLAPFLLTNLLLDTLKAGAPSRIINVTDENHRKTTINFDDMEFNKRFSWKKSYQQSSLANILFTKKLSQQLKGTGVTANCVHPGILSDGLFSIKWIVRRFFSSPPKDAQTIVYLATSPELEKVSGEYFANSRRIKPGPAALRQDFADKLWEKSKMYVGI